jgi:hypothetical protein
MPIKSETLVHRLLAWSIFCQRPRLQLRKGAKRSRVLIRRDCANTRVPTAGHYTYVELRLNLHHRRARLDMHRFQEVLQRLFLDAGFQPLICRKEDALVRNV